MSSKPVSEIIYSILFGLQILILTNATYISYTGFVGWEDVIAVIQILIQLVIGLISIPFLIKAMGRGNRFSWFVDWFKFLIELPLILMITLLIIMASNGTGTPILTILTLGINAIPVGIFFLRIKQSNQEE